MNSAAVRDDLRPDWLADAPAAAPRGRVVRSDDALVRIVDLPSVDELDEGDAHAGAGAEDPADATGGAAVTWALGYRSGFDTGHAEGHATAWTTGHREGFEQATAAAFARYERTLRELEATAAHHLAALDELTDAVATQATELAFEIAGAVVGRELALSGDPGVDAVRRAVAALPGRGEAVARLHPDDLDQLALSTDELAPGRALRLVADPSVTPGDCTLESGATTIDASISGALRRVRAVLGLHGAATLTSHDGTGS